MKRECYKRLYFQIRLNKDTHQYSLEALILGIKIISTIGQSISQSKNISFLIKFRPPSPKGALSKFLRSTVDDVI